MKIGIVAAGSQVKPEVAPRVGQLLADTYGADAPAIVFHPQCFMAEGHFAGSDSARADAFVEIANDSSFDAVWFARGGYGAGRIAEVILSRLNGASRNKIYMGHSDAGMIMAGLYKAGFENIFHGPFPGDIIREGGEQAVLRAVDFITTRNPATLEPSIQPNGKTVAFNISILSHLIGTSLLPDLTDHVLMLEEVSEYMYSTDRDLLHITSSPDIRRVKGIRLGRFNAVKENTPDFGQTPEQMMQHWCAVSGIPYLGRADIGHDIDNKIVPFGSFRQG